MRKSLLVLTALLLFGIFAFAQNRVITGKVTDETGAPIPFATVKIKGSKGGTSADANGNFSISTNGTGNTLIISAASMETKQIDITGQTTTNISLKSTGQLSEIVVTGVGVGTSKKKLGISVESVTADKLPPTPTSTIDQALVGKIPGAIFQSIDGTPGAPTAITLRGINTLQGGTKPLILLDGVEIKTDINTLDLTSIERVEVVQGAASSSLYGAQGANGVIQLFSKKGKKGSYAINFSSSISSNKIINQGNVHQARMHTYKTDASGKVVDNSGNPIALDDNGIYQGVVYQNAANGYATAQYNPNNIYNKSYDQNLKYYDHIGQLFQSANSLTNSLNISGGDGKIDYSFSGANNHQNSTIRNNGYVDRSNFTSNVGFELFKGFKVRSVTELVYTKNTLNPYYSFGRNNIFNVLNLAPFYDLNQKLPDGNFPFYLGSDNGVHSANGYNPNYDFQYVSSRDNKVDIFQNVQANYSINKFLELDAKYGINHTREDTRYLYKDQSQNVNVNYEGGGESFYNGDDFNGEIDNFNTKETFQNFLGSAFIRTDFKRDFNINFPITTSTQISYDYRNNKFANYITYGKHLQFFDVFNLQQTATQGVGADNITTFVTYGYLVNQHVDFGDFGGFTAGLRSDYSSAFGAGSKPQTFPHGDAYLRLSSFDFWKNHKLGNIINEFKIRGAYGEAGIQPLAFDRYPTISSLNIGSALALSLKRNGVDPNIRVEISKEAEVGTDISFNGLKGSWLSRINVSGTYWDRKGKDVIFNVSAVPSTGVNTNKTNAVDIASHGIQASLNISAYKSKDITWDFTANFSKQTSKITGIAGHGDIILTTAAGSTSLVLTEGQTIGQIYGYKAFTSLDQRRLNGTPYIDKANYGKYEIVNGRVVDTATKAIQFTNEKYALGTGNPKFNMSFINQFTFKDFVTLGFQFDWVYKNYIYNQTKEWMYRDGFSGDYDEQVTINGKTAAFSPYHRSAYAAVFGDLNGAGRNGTKDYFLEDASFVRLRNVSLGFDVSRFIHLKAIKRFQLVFSGRNIATWTKYTGFDPEINSGGNAYSAFDRGIDHNSTPNNKSYQIGLNLGF